MSYACGRAVRALALVVATTAAPAAASSQANCVGAGDPVVLVHGLNSDGGTWASFDQYLRAQLSVRVCRPTLGEARPLAVQADTLVNRYSTLSPAPILIGHSQGGLVARQASKALATRGIITIGTPHGGAPIANHEADLRWMDQLAFIEAFTIAQAWVIRANAADPFDDPPYSRFDDIRYWLAQAATAGAAALSVATQFMINDFYHNQASLLDLGRQTYFLDSLNSPANLAREATAIPLRVGFISDAGQYEPFVGPFALMFENPSNAYDVMAGVVALGYTTFDYGIGLFYDTDYGSDWWLSDVLAGAAALDLGSMLFSLPDTWCGWIDGCPNDMGDFIVPFLRQWYPGATRNSVISYGPTHNRETTDAEVADRIRFEIAIALAATQ